ncbi:MAG: hypothetical protein ACRDIC_20925 [bacterium]
MSAALHSRLIVPIGKALEEMRAEGVIAGRPRWIEFGQPSMADYGGVLRGSGRYLAVEVKRPGASPTKEQARWLAAVNEAGGVGIWADDVGGLMEVLDGL